MHTHTANADWTEFDDRTRAELDRQYLAELPRWHGSRVTPEGIRAYLAYRHERPGAQITTYEEAQIRKILQAASVSVDEPDLVESEEHTDWLERFGATVLHLTNHQTYLAVMIPVTILAMIVFLALVIVN